MTIGDVLGWMGVIVIFALVLSLIYFLIARANPSKASDRWLEYALRQVSNRDRRIRQLLAERAEWKKEISEYHQLRKELESAGVLPAPDSLPLLIAAIASEEGLDLDMASLRAVRTATGMQFLRVLDVTLPKLRQAVNRERANGRAVNVHLAAHCTEYGVNLGGQVVDAAALSEVLDGVQVLLIAGCDGDSIGDFLGVVPYPVSMMGKVSDEDAAQFARLFWTQIGNRVAPGEAVRFALNRSPSGMSEYVKSHF